MQEDRSSNDGKHGFHAHQQGSDRRVGEFLGNHLKGVPDPAGYDPAINDRQDRGRQFFNARRLENEGGDRRNDRYGNELDRGDTNRIAALNEMITA